MQTEPQKTNGAHPGIRQAEAKAEPLTAAEKFKAAKEQKRKAKEEKKAKALPKDAPVEKLEEGDRNRWLYEIESVRRFDAELTVARLSLKSAEEGFQKAKEKHVEAMREIYAKYKMNSETDGANLETGVITRKGNGKP